ncbi:MAG TPA: RNA polymerase sigma factor RpoD/SigA [Solirubrobacteraceae bacterium]|nr:RNA polymerase sigma factor RpoD/SigA [Solirubrobacteraceae bacterium]
MSALGRRGASAEHSTRDRAQGAEARIRPLTAAAETRLAARVRLGELAAKHEMTERNLGLVFALARTYRNSSVPFNDLVQEGTIGLMRAVEHFDHRRGIKFSTYAVWWIRRSLLDAIGAEQTIRIPTQAAQQRAAMRRAEQELERRGIRRASVQQVADRSGLSESNIRTLQDVARVTSSLDEAVGDDAGPLGEMIGDPGLAEPDQRLTDHERRRYAWELLKMLPTRHRRVLIRRYGIGGGRPRSHREIGESLGVREERSRQLEREALHRLRELPTHDSAIAQTLTS